MKKIPTLFKRTYDGNRVKGITDEVTPVTQQGAKGRKLTFVQTEFWE